MQWKLVITTSIIINEITLQIVNQSLIPALEELSDMVNFGTGGAVDEIDLASVTYLLSTIVNSLRNQSAEPAVSEVKTSKFLILIF